MMDGRGLGFGFCPGKKKKMEAQRVRMFVDKISSKTNRPKFTHVPNSIFWPPNIVQDTGKLSYSHTFSGRVHQ